MKLRSLVAALVAPLAILLVATGGPADAAIAAYTLPGGMGYVDGNSTSPDHACTIGFNVNNSSGHRVSITAGHCGPVGEDEYAGSYSRIGTINRRVYGSAGDYAVLGPVSYSQYSLPPRVVSAKKAGETLRVRGAKSPVVGETLCWTGSASAVTHCGNVTAVGVATTYSGHTVNNTFRVKGCGHMGDSGGPIFAIRHDSANNVDYAVAVGILVAVPASNTCDSNTIIAGQPILPVLKAYSLTMP